MFPKTFIKLLSFATKRQTLRSRKIETGKREMMMGRKEKGLKTNGLGSSKRKQKIPGEVFERKLFGRNRRQTRLIVSKQLRLKRK